MLPLLHSSLPFSFRSAHQISGRRSLLAYRFLTSSKRMSSSESSSSSSALRPVVLCGPSGVGKSTLIKKLFADLPNQFGFSVSHTTRQARPGETPGVSYHYVTREEFQRLVDEGAFLEHATFGGNRYGTSAKAVEDVSKPGPAGEKRRALLDIDTQGVKLIKANHAQLNPLYVFITPPSISALRSRLKARGTDDDEAIGRRLAMAASEMAYARAGHHDVIVKNDDVDRAYGVLKSAIQGTLQGAGDALPEEEEEEKALRSQAPVSS